MNHIIRQLAVGFCCVALNAGFAEDDFPTDLLERLGSPTFQQRAAASRDLKKLSFEQLQKLAQQADTVTSAEAVVRVLAEMDNRFVSGTATETAQIAIVLEALRLSNRALVSEAAERTLQLHWQKRLDVVLNSIEEFGAIVKRGQFGGPQRFMDRSIELNIFIDRKWKGTYEDIKLFRRIVGERRANPIRVTIYLLTGHPVDDDSQQLLRETFGPSAVQDRGEAALGISSYGTNNGQIRIGTVTEGGAASAAGLRPGDFILAVELKEEIENPIKPGLVYGDNEFGLKRIPFEGFDDLVDYLKGCRAGQEIQLRVIARGRIQVIDVKLTHWGELKSRD